MAMRILFAASAGGHLRQLDVLRPWWTSHERHWVTFETEDALTMLQGEDVTRAFHPTTRNIPNLIRNAVVMLSVIRKFKPDVVVSTGAAVAVPAFLWAKIFGIRTVFIEVYDRIDSPTLTARLVGPFTDLFLVQWDEQLAFHRRAVLAGQLL
jgi:UDP-N-acetylglucosamine:LPS N-acetylglucosamine transferase